MSYAFLVFFCKRSLATSLFATPLPNGEDQMSVGRWSTAETSMASLLLPRASVVEETESYGCVQWAAASWQYKIKTASRKRRTPGFFYPIMPNSMVVLKGTHVIVNYEHCTRVKLEHDNGHKSIICSGFILNEPIVDAEKWVLEAAALGMHRLRNKENLSYITVTTPDGVPGTELVCKPQMFSQAWWRLETHGENLYVLCFDAALAYGIEPLQISVGVSTVRMTVCLTEFRNQHRQYWMIMPESAPFIPRPFVPDTAPLVLDSQHSQDRDFFAPHTQCYGPGPGSGGGVHDDDYFAAGP
ncbi:predicted protein [Postia placenta Mad-698-R]|nr:predicted protein [Postia placenta Mad-698-R]